MASGNVRYELLVLFLPVYEVVEELELSDAGSGDPSVESEI
jgi:hypothetical protein